MIHLHPGDVVKYTNKSGVESNALVVEPYGGDSDQVYLAVVNAESVTHPVRVIGPVVPKRDASEGSAFYTRSTHKHVKQDEPEDTVDPFKPTPRSPDLETTPELDGPKGFEPAEEDIEDKRFDERPSNTSPSKGQATKPLQPVETNEGVTVKAKRLLPIRKK